MAPFNQPPCASSLKFPILMSQTRIQITMITFAKTSPKSFNFCFNGVGSEICDVILVWISPIAVAFPVKATTALAWPTVTVVPENSILTWSCLTALSSLTGRVSFPTLSLSPVRMAWSTRKLLLWMDRTRQSAGIRSPTATSTMSPGTSSSARILET